MTREELYPGREVWAFSLPEWGPEPAKVIRAVTDGRVTVRRANQAAEGVWPSACFLSEADARRGAVESCDQMIGAHRRWVEKFQAARDRIGQAADPDAIEFGATPTGSELPTSERASAGELVAVEG